AGADPDPRTFAQPAFSCATATDDRALAKRALALMSEVDPYAAVYWSSKLVAQGRGREALAVLGKADVAGTGDDGLLRADHHVRVGAGVLVRDWDTVIRLLDERDDLDPQLRAYAASTLYDAGYRRTGRRLLAAVCAELAAEQRAICEDLVKR
ncbi:MAG: hypothetical protein AAF211_06825, partial [Myxococcota bacterium]